MDKTKIQTHDGFNCNAKTRGGTPCRQRAGWGTDHVGSGRCKLHGGKSPGAPKGNQNALKTGFWTAKAIAERKQARKTLADSLALLKSLTDQKE
mgnify:CR=1 FL=1